MASARGWPSAVSARPAMTASGAGEVDSEVHRVGSECGAALAARGARRGGGARGVDHEHHGRAAPPRTRSPAPLPPPPPQAQDRRDRDPGRQPARGSRPRPAPRGSAPCRGHRDARGSAGRSETPTAHSVSSAAPASTPECTASARMPRLPVAKPTMSLTATRASAAPSEKSAVRRATDTGLIVLGRHSRDPLG